MPKKIKLPPTVRPSVTCSQCDGAGKHQISDELFEVYAAAQTEAYVTAVMLHKTIGKNFTVTAMNNRLEELREHALLTRIRVGHTWRYYKV